MSRPTLPSPSTERHPVFDSALRPPPFVEEAIELYRYRDLVGQWSLRNIRLRYKRSMLGVAWTLLQPLMLMTILTIVFSAAFRFPVPNYPLYLLPGLLLFDFVSRSTLQTTEEIISSQNLAKRIHVPRSAFAVATVLSYLANWAIAMIPLLLIMLVLHQPLTWSLLTVPLGMALTAIFALGLGMIIATLGAFFHDIHLTYQVLLTAWLYATPIIYPLAIVPERLRPWFLLNPLLHLCELVRSPVYDGQVAASQSWLFGLASASVAVVVGWSLFTHWRGALAART